MSVAEECAMFLAIAAVEIDGAFSGYKELENQRTP
jgi:hypothetical protein